MAEVKWIKVTTDIFDDEKILLIESMPDADSMIVIWFKLLCLAGKQNNSGVFLMNGRIPYTDKMLATIFRRNELTVKMALDVFEQFGMIEILDNTITIPNWEKHQNIDGLNRIREQNRIRKQNQRERERALLPERDSHVTVTQSHATDKIRIEEEKIREDKSSTKGKYTRFTPPTVEQVAEYCSSRNNSVDPQRFVDYYESNGWCVGRNKMKDWKAAVRTWENNGYSGGKGNSKSSTQPVFSAGNAELEAIKKLQRIKEGI